VTPALRTLQLDGLDYAYWDWPGDGSPLLFVHATGFHGRCWDQVIRHLPGRRAIAPDLRGHGRSAKPAPPYHWQSFGRDLVHFAEALELRGAIGIGHSMGGHTVVSCAAQRPETFASLVLVDPTIWVEERYGHPPLDSSFIERRRNVWASPEEMYDRFAGRVPFSRWKPAVLRDYCEFGLLPDGDRYVLACPPAIERSIYGHSTEAEANLHPLVSSIRQPALVIRGGVPWTSEYFNLDASPTDSGLASKFPNGTDVMLEGKSHYIPMETPEYVAEMVRSWEKDMSLE
jgi:pimeloyl-ACP methyl ester carboxylesterase